VKPHFEVPSQFAETTTVNMYHENQPTLYFFYRRNTLVYVSQSLVFPVKTEEKPYDSFTYYPLSMNEVPEEYEAYFIAKDNPEFNRMMPPNSRFRTIKQISESFKDKTITRKVVEATIETQSIEPVFIDNCKTPYYDSLEISKHLDGMKLEVPKPKKRMMMESLALISADPRRKRKPSEEITSSIRERLILSDASIKVIADEFDVSEFTVYRIYWGLASYGGGVEHREITDVVLAECQEYYTRMKNLNVDMMTQQQRELAVICDSILRIFAEGE
jgi:hypothetical protein